jgi:membrane-bound lytic murein transglycosylase B
MTLGRVEHSEELPLQHANLPKGIPYALYAGGVPAGESPWARKLQRGLCYKSLQIMKMSLTRCFAGAVLCAWAAAVSCAPPAPGKSLRADVEVFIEEMAGKHQYDSQLLRRLFSRVEPRPSILRAMSAPSTARPWHEFRRSHVDAMRVAGGLRFWEQNAAALARARRDFGVPEEIIVATIGIETLYGRSTGSIRVLDALATLAFDYPKRADFFRGELEHYLLLIREAGLDPLTVRGSYAGAMGIPQFMPSSYRKYAVDFDGDGRRHLWGEAADAIGSVANYYRSYGWTDGEDIVVAAEVGATEVELPRTGGLERSKVADLRRSGVVPVTPLAEAAEVILIALETEGGLRYWLGLQNFYVITRYNRSINYAMAVHELARELKAQRIQRP